MCLCVCICVSMRVCVHARARARVCVCVCEREREIIVVIYILFIIYSQGREVIITDEVDHHHQTVMCKHSMYKHVLYQSFSPVGS